ncbi:hypothetical protein RFI_37690, partial [Reticulomyxa filosa]
IFGDTAGKLRQICATSSLNELNASKSMRDCKVKPKKLLNRSQEENELKINREMCLHILWNILKYPKHIKYRQIHKQALYNYLSQKCHTLGADFDQVLWKMEYCLQGWGFKKGYDDNWYYQYDRIQLLHLWECYCYWIYQQIMYVLFCCC